MYSRLSNKTDQNKARLGFLGIIQEFGGLDYGEKFENNNYLLVEHCLSDSIKKVICPVAHHIVAVKNNFVILLHNLFYSERLNRLISTKITETSFCNK